jgi:TPR repeat protein
MVRSFVNSLVLYLAFGIAAAGGRALAQTPQPQPPQQQSAQPRLNATEVSELRSKAEKGDSSAQFALGKAHEGGNGVPKSDELAVKWYRRAADQGNADAEARLGVMYRLGLGVNPDKEEAVRWYRKAAKQGSSQAMFNLGAAYYNGDGVPSNPTLAYAWFLLAQDAGNHTADDAVKRTAEQAHLGSAGDAILQVAAMYEKGDDLPQSYAEAAKWYRKSANNDPSAAVKLATLLINGIGIAQDYGQAMSLCQNAAKQNYGPAAYCVGYIYQHGLGTGVDLKEAAKWYEQGSKLRSTPAMMSLAEMYWKGEGVGVDRPQAYIYFFLARASGMEDPRVQAQMLWNEMSRDEIKHLEKKLRDLHFDPQKVFNAMQVPSAPDATKGPSKP